MGIGGAGLSGYALVAKAWGAEVAGWDRHETPYLEYVRAAGIPVTISDEIAPAPDGYESVVSTAYLSEGQTLGPVSKSRAEFLAELVSLQDSIVVSGAHGKTTTTGMIAFALERAGRDPSFLIGGEIPQLGGNARAGSGWLVVEGDESDRTVERLRPQIAVVTNVDLDHHSEFASRAEVEDLFERWLADVPHVVRADELEPVDSSSRSPASTTVATRPPRSPRSSSPGCHGRRRRSISPSSPERADAWSSAARRVACACSTTTRITPPRFARRSRRFATDIAFSSCSSRTSTRARATSLRTSAPRSPPQMWPR